MLKERITYQNVDGETVTEDFYFNMTKAELMKTEHGAAGSFKDRLENAIYSKSPYEIIEVMEMILRKSYGIRTKDGKFTKPPGAFDEFMTSEAYSVLFYNLMTDNDYNVRFLNGIMPADLLEEAQKTQNAVSSNVFNRPQDEPSTPPTHLGVPNAEEMTEQQLNEALGLTEQITGGYTDEQIIAMSNKDLRGKPREVLLRAYKLRNG